MKLKTKRAMCAIVGAAGMLLMALTAMQSDANSIQLGTIVRQELLGLAM